MILKFEAGSKLLANQFDLELEPLVAREDPAPRGLLMEDHALPTRRLAATSFLSQKAKRSREDYDLHATRSWQQTPLARWDPTARKLDGSRRWDVIRSREQRDGTIDLMYSVLRTITMYRREPVEAASERGEVPGFSRRAATGVARREERSQR